MNDFDEKELVMIEMSAIALGAKQNNDGSLTMTVEQLMLLCVIAVQASIEQETNDSISTCLIDTHTISMLMDCG